jgi:2-polyprenyl-3-methyl-5-hydroxy-6-metoxy-1,4-benzoquinol methylase
MQEALPNITPSQHPLHCNISVRMREEPCLAFLGAQPHENVLDVGCGLGYFLLLLANRDVECHGIDVSASSVEYVRRHITPYVQIGSCFSIPYPDETFDAVLFCEVIEHVEDDVAALREIHRVLKPGGRIVVSTPAYEGWFTRTYLKRLGHHEGGERHVRDGYYAPELQRSLEQAGFRVTQRRLAMFLLSEWLMELTKVVYMLKRGSFSAQSDLLSVQSTVPFRILKALMVVLVPLCRLEDRIMTPLFHRGHSHVMAAVKC